STTTSLPGASRPVARTRSSSSSAILACRPGHEELRGLVEALQAHLTDALELEVVPGEIDHGACDEDLPTRRPRRHARGQVDLAPVVVAVAVERRSVVHADARQRPAIGDDALEADGPIDHGGRV